MRFAIFFSFDVKNRVFNGINFLENSFKLNDKMSIMSSNYN